MTEDNIKPDNQQPLVDGVPIYLPDNLRVVSFSNNIFAQFSPEEFSIDFLNMSGTGASFVARVALTPSHMKRFTKLLHEKIKEYEDMFGEIPENINPIK